MKKCLCRAFTDNPIEVELLRIDLEKLGLTLHTISHQAYVEFDDKALVQPVLDLFEQFERYGYYVEF